MRDTPETNLEEIKTTLCHRAQPVPATATQMPLPLPNKGVHAHTVCHTSVDLVSTYAESTTLHIKTHRS